MVQPPASQRPWPLASLEKAPRSLLWTVGRTDSTSPYAAMAEVKPVRVKLDISDRHNMNSSNPGRRPTSRRGLIITFTL